ncbi:MAG TPA: hypothetical protein VHA14_17525 [Bryobacteraceae bacterium]|nr:hypothetical protein [Bryobacteraceae bacterium]
MLQRNIAEIGMLQERTAAANLWTWLQSAGATALLRNIAMIVSLLASVLFLIFLTRQSGSPSQTSPLFRTIAQIASIAGVAALVIRIGGQIYAALVFTPRDYATALVYGQITRSQFILSGALSALPDFCWTVAAWIIFKSASQHSSNELHS